MCSGAASRFRRFPAVSLALVLACAATCLVSRFVVGVAAGVLAFLVVRLPTAGTIAPIDQVEFHGETPVSTHVSSRQRQNS